MWWCMQQLHQRVRGHRHPVAAPILLQPRGAPLRLPSAVRGPGLLPAALLHHLPAVPGRGGGAAPAAGRGAWRPAQVGVGVVRLLLRPVAHFCSALVPPQLPLVVETHDPFIFCCGIHHTDSCPHSSTNLYISDSSLMCVCATPSNT